MIEIVKRHLTQNPCYKANVNKADSRYVCSNSEGHRVALCILSDARPSALSFIKTWDKPTYTNSCVHGVIDAETGIGYETLPPNFRGWHGASGPKGSVNNTHIGIEMCESRWIKYTSGAKFEVLDLAKARADCKRAYATAVYWFAKLAKEWNWNVDTDIISHYEGGKNGIASTHADPEHYWTGLGMPYTMDTFRSAVKRKMEEMDMPTEAELEEIVTRILDDKFHSMWQSEYKKEIAKRNDNDSGKWSKKAREWAVDTGIVAGVGKLSDGNVNYAWEQPLTREQYVTMEYRQALGGGNKYD